MIRFIISFIHEHYTKANGNFYKLFLKEIGLPQNVIQIYEDYHYGLDKSGNRISVKEYQEVHTEEINLFNTKSSSKKIKILLIFL